MHKNILQIIGNTPIVQLKNDNLVYLKLELFNPGGSMKDRAAIFMIEEAERNGILKPGGTIIDASSGNFATTLAMIGIVKGYKVIITVPEKISSEKLDSIKAYGAEVHICPTTNNIDDPNHYRNKASLIHKSTPNSFRPNQYYNENNSLSHYKFLGPEIWQQTAGKITHLFATIGTGGTITGVGKYLKEQNPNIKIIGVDSDVSYRATNGKPGTSQVEGMGIDVDMMLVDYNIIDEIINVSDVDAYNTMRLLPKTDGILVGPSSGAVTYAAINYPKTINNLIVVICPDSGRAYFSKFNYKI